MVLIRIVIFGFKMGLGTIQQYIQVYSDILLKIFLWLTFNTGLY